MDRRVEIRIEAGVADVRMARPEKLNALDDAMFHALVEAGTRLKTERGVRAVVLSGEGRAFSSGRDIGGAAGVPSSQAAPPRPSAAQRLGPRVFGDANLAQYTALVWQDIPVPVIAAVHGVAFGGGLQIALGADLRYVTADAKLSVMEIRWGLVPDMSGMLTLHDLVRPDVARELVWSGRIFTGTQAVDLGLATRVCADPRADALEFALDVAGRNPHAIRAGKRLSRLAAGATRAAILQAESDEQIELIESPNHREAVEANLNKRPARFADP